jgi:hypothetical protein
MASPVISCLEYARPRIYGISNLLEDLMIHMHQLAESQRVPQLYGSRIALYPFNLLFIVWTMGCLTLKVGVTVVVEVLSR